MQNFFELDKPPITAPVVVPAAVGIILLLIDSRFLVDQFKYPLAITLFLISALLFSLAPSMVWTKVHKSVEQAFHARKSLTVRKTAWYIKLDRLKFRFHAHDQNVEVPWASIKGLYAKKEVLTPVDNLLSEKRARTHIFLTTHAQDAALRSVGFDLDSPYFTHKELFAYRTKCHVLEVDFGNHADEILVLASTWHALEAETANESEMARQRRSREEAEKERLMSERIAQPETEAVVEGQ